MCALGKVLVSAAQSARLFCLSASGAQKFEDEQDRERTQNLQSVSANQRSFLHSKSCNFSEIITWNSNNSVRYDCRFLNRQKLIKRIIFTLKTLKLSAVHFSLRASASNFSERPCNALLSNFVLEKASRI